MREVTAIACREYWNGAPIGAEEKEQVFTADIERWPTNIKKLEGMMGDDDKFYKYVFPGGYPVYYLDVLYVYICPDCANKPHNNVRVIDCEINYEDTELFCDDCGCKIESAYGEEDGDASSD